MKFNRFEEIDVWKVSRSLVKEIYLITGEKPFQRDFNLVDQIRRCAVSVPSNIAEGYERKSNAEFIRYLYIAKGSAGELRTQLYLAKDLEYIAEEKFMELIKSAKKFLKVYRAS